MPMGTMISETMEICKSLEKALNIGSIANDAYLKITNCNKLKIIPIL